MSLYCGGISVQHNSINKGRCGLCGDSFSGTHPHQAGGRYATGTISRSYMPGQVIDVRVKLVANHRGFLTFALCAHNNPNTSPDRQCFLNNQLLLSNGERYFSVVGRGNAEFSIQVKLPNIQCQHCILQSTYTGGNNWGKGPQSAEVQTQDCLTSQQGKLGCGNQETFRGCSDICIGASCPTQECAKVGQSGGGRPLTQSPFTTVPEPLLCRSAGIKQQYFSVQGDEYCRDACLYQYREVCHMYANTKFLCYCEEGATGRYLSYEAVMLDKVYYPGERRL